MQVRGAGAFLAPYLARMLALLLHPALLVRRAGGELAGEAAGVRDALVAAVPPRLLLPPLFAQLDAALEARPHGVC